MPSAVINDVAATFSYLQWQDRYNAEKPYQILIDLPDGVEETQRTNLVFCDGPKENVTDVTGREASFTLDRNGFAFLKDDLPIRSAEFADRTIVERVYLPACERIIRQTLDDVDEVVFYNWRTRTSSPSRLQGKVIDFNDPTTPLGPSTQAHVDQSPSSVLERVHRLFPDRAEHLLKGRVRLLNLWRPTNGPIVEFPLAICDGSTLPPDYLVETDRIRRTYTGCTMYTMQCESIRWYYKYRQDVDDVLLFKSFDSDSDTVPYAAHAAFDLPKPSDDEYRSRESVEVRALIFTYQKN
ncbi:unnamed protein product [Alternaria alternata]